MKEEFNREIAEKSLNFVLNSNYEFTGGLNDALNQARRVYCYLTGLSEVSEYIGKELEDPRLKY